MADSIYHPKERRSITANVPASVLDHLRREWQAKSPVPGETILFADIVGELILKGLEAVRQAKPRHIKHGKMA